ncbi:MAG: type I-B CRISPR-associated endonuclease Cas1 [Desulfotomaculum sp.]|nr:type I-B CRISPR-associated endonuclease Cas1 [Desulfotomaculum sp.]
MKKSIYITQNGQLKRRDNTLLFLDEEGKRNFIPVEDTNDIFVFSEMEINTKLLDFLSQKNICVHFFNYYGYYSGTYYPREHLNSGHVILKQAEHYINIEKRLDLARRFIKGSIQQMKKVVYYYLKRRDDELAVTESVAKYLDNILEDLSDAKSIEELMSFEGHAREKYYSCFDEILKNKDFKFEKRSKRPPLNRLNALISFGNAMCYTIVLSELYKTYLDPRIGFLHATNFRRFSLNLDISEIFKPIMVDRLIFMMINKKIITIKDFEHEHGGGILLNKSGKRKFIEQLEKRMRTTIKHRHLGKNVSYRRLIRLEAYKLQKHILGEKEYEPYHALW